jgi:hypothetical protein
LDGVRNTEQLEEFEALHVLVSVFTHEGLRKKKIWNKNRIQNFQYTFKKALRLSNTFKNKLHKLESVASKQNVHIYQINVNYPQNYLFL